MKNPFKKSTSPTEAHSVAAAEEQLARRAKDLQMAQAALAEAERVIKAAYADDEQDADTILQLEDAREKAETAYKRHERAHAAAAERLEVAKQAEADRFHREKAGQFNATLKTRKDLAEKLAKNAAERSELIKRWHETDVSLSEFEAAGLVSPNASAGQNWGLRRLLPLLEFEDRRAGVPGTGMRWDDATTIPSLVAEVERDHATIRGA